MLVVEAQLKRLQSMKISVNDMIHTKIVVKSEISQIEAGGSTVGDWVEVMHDFSPGNNSGGGVGVITEIVENLSHVRYLHSERIFREIHTYHKIDDGPDAIPERKNLTEEALDEID